MFQQGVPNVANRTIFEGDNLDVMRGINTDSIDMIYLDPPFNSNEDYGAPIGDDQSKSWFKDTWELTDVTAREHVALRESKAHPHLYELIDTIGKVHSEAMQAYLTKMSVRLIEMRRILKPNGSIFLHCDDTADGYLRILLDAIFGLNNRQSSITWKRTFSHNDAVLGRVADTIYMYGTPAKHMVKVPLDRSYVDANYNKEDADGRYSSIVLTGPGASEGESGKPWRGYDPSKAGQGRHWSPPLTGEYATYIEDNFISGYTSIKGVHDRLNALYEAGLVLRSQNDVPRLKRYLMPTQNQMVSNIWPDIPPVVASSRESVDYATQKPVKLLKRILQVASNEGEWVLDPFCGCATTCVAADELGRQWIGIDISPRVLDRIKERAEKQKHIWYANEVTVNQQPPNRTDQVMLQLPQDRAEILTRRLKEQDNKCKACEEPLSRNTAEIDHIFPQSRGGDSYFENLQILCPRCNRVKGNRTMAHLYLTLEERGEIPGNMYTNMYEGMDRSLL